MQYYLIRLDDACPTMKRDNWARMERLLDFYGVKPMVGIVPNNEDKKLMVAPEDPCFWKNTKNWQEKGWAIALHGYNHCYISKEAGINPMWHRSEFAGVALREQENKIKEGYAILKEQGLIPIYFFAPSHTFDENTLIALRNSSDIRVVSDTIGRYPYKKGDMWFLPQITGHCVKMPFSGIYTFCYHPNTMNDKAFEVLEDFIKANKNCFISFDDINYTLYGEKKIFDKLLSRLFFIYRDLRGLK